MFGSPLSLFANKQNEEQQVLGGLIQQVNSTPPVPTDDKATPQQQPQQPQQPQQDQAPSSLSQPAPPPNTPPAETPPPTGGEKIVPSKPTVVPSQSTNPTDAPLPVGTDGKAPYDPSAFEESSGAALAEGGNHPKGNAGVFFDVWRQYGIAPNMIYGAMGNIQQESGFNPQAYNKGEDAFGIMQWRGDRLENLKRYAKKNGKDYSDIRTQAEFALWEKGVDAKGNPNDPHEYNQWQKVQGETVSDLARGFDSHVERSSGEHVDSRVAYAEAFARGEAFPTSITASGERRGVPTSGGTGGAGRQSGEASPQEQLTWKEQILGKAPTDEDDNSRGAQIRRKRKAQLRALGVGLGQMSHGKTVNVSDVLDEHQRRTENIAQRVRELNAEKKKQADISKLRSSLPPDLQELAESDLGLEMAADIMTARMKSTVDADAPVVFTPEILSDAAANYPQLHAMMVSGDVAIAKEGLQRYGQMIASPETGRAATSYSPEELETMAGEAEAYSPSLASQIRSGSQDGIETFNNIVQARAERNPDHEYTDEQIGKIAVAAEDVAPHLVTGIEARDPKALDAFYNAIQTRAGAKGTSSGDRERFIQETVKAYDAEHGTNLTTLARTEEGFAKVVEFLTGEAVDPTVPLEDRAQWIVDRVPALEDMATASEADYERAAELAKDAFKQDLDKMATLPNRREMRKWIENHPRWNKYADMAKTDTGLELATEAIQKELNNDLAFDLTAKEAVLEDDMSARAAEREATAKADRDRMLEEDKLEQIREAYKDDPAALRSIRGMDSTNAMEILQARTGKAFEFDLERQQKALDNAAYVDAMRTAYEGAPWIDRAASMAAVDPQAAQEYIDQQIDLEANSIAAEKADIASDTLQGFYNNAQFPDLAEMVKGGDIIGARDVYLQRTKDKRTTAQLDYEYTKDLSPQDAADYWSRIGTANGIENQQQKAALQVAATVLDGKAKKIATNRTRMAKMDAALQILEVEDLDTGIVTAAMMPAFKALEEFGISVKEGMPALEAFTSISNSMIDEYKAEGVGAMSDRDADRYRTIVSGVEKTPAGNALILYTQKELLRRQDAEFRAELEWFGSNGTSNDGREDFIQNRLKQEGLDGPLYDEFNVDTADGMDSANAAFEAARYGDPVIFVYKDEDGHEQTQMWIKGVDEPPQTE